MIIGSTSMMESNPYASEKPQSLTDKMAESEERREFMQSRVAQQLHEAEIDPEIAFGLDAPPIGIDEMSYTDSTLESDGNWYEASKIVHDYREKINAYDDRPADARRQRSRAFRNSYCKRTLCSSSVGGISSEH